MVVDCILSDSVNIISIFFERNFRIQRDAVIDKYKRKLDIHEILTSKCDEIFGKEPPTTDP